MNEWQTVYMGQCVGEDREEGNQERGERGEQACYDKDVSKEGNVEMWKDMDV